MACFIFLIKTRLIQEPSKIGITPFGSVKHKIWILQKQQRICYTVTRDVRGRDWQVGSGDTRDPRDRETETGETLVTGETRRRRGLGRIQGHLRVPLLKATLLTYFTCALLDPRVLAVGNGGSTALRAIRRRARPMPSRRRFTPSISELRESDRDKNGGKWWSREAWPRRRWARAELRRGRTAWSSAKPPHPCSTVAREVTPR